MTDNRTWQEICEAASKEPDPARLSVLISDLMQALAANDEESPIENLRGNVGHPTHLP